MRHDPGTICEEVFSEMFEGNETFTLAEFKTNVIDIIPKTMTE